jgi:hypothetical protein
MICVKDLDTGLKSYINYRNTLEEAKKAVSSENIVEISYEEYNKGSKKEEMEE